MSAADMRGERGGVRELVTAAVVVVLAYFAYVTLKPGPIRDSKERMSRVFLNRDAQNLIAAESAYYAAHGTYSADTIALGYVTRTPFRLQWEAADASGWRAVLGIQGYPGCEVGAQGPPRPVPGSPPSLAPCLRQIKLPSP